MVYARASDRLPDPLIGGLMGGRATDIAAFRDVYVYLEPGLILIFVLIFFLLKMLENRGARRCENGDDVSIRWWYVEQRSLVSGVQPHHARLHAHWQRRQLHSTRAGRQTRLGRVACRHRRSSCRRSKYVVPSMRCSIVLWEVNDVVALTGAFGSRSQGGARLCYRYEERQLTNKPLWPWPMDTRIRDAMKISAKVDHSEKAQKQVNYQLFSSTTIIET